MLTRAFLLLLRKCLLDIQLATVILQYCISYIFSIWQDNPIRLWPFLNHCECHHLELFLFCLKAHNSVLHGKCIIPIIVFSLVVVVLAVLVCGFDDLLVAIAAKLVYLLFCKKKRLSFLLLCCCSMFKLWPDVFVIELSFSSPYRNRIITRRKYIF